MFPYVGQLLQHNLLNYLFGRPVLYEQKKKYIHSIGKVAKTNCQLEGTTPACIEIYFTIMEFVHP